MSNDRCPYDGHATDGQLVASCRTSGLLCDMCKEDRADERATMVALSQLVERQEVDPVTRLATLASQLSQRQRGFL